MYKLIKIENGLYHITKPINDSEDIVIAIITRSGKGYTRSVYHELSKKWIQPAAFNYFATLADVKRRYDIK